MNPIAFTALSDCLEERLTPVLADLQRQGWCVRPGFFDAPLCAALQDCVQQYYQEGDFRQATIGQGRDNQVDRRIRRDQILWLDQCREHAAVHGFLTLMERLQALLNQYFFLSLAEFEGHFAWYPPGSFYRKHLDQFRADDSRKITLLCYLNEAWQADDGGQLRLYDPRDPERIMLEVAPEYGTLVCFASAEIYHEVLTTQRPRLSIAGWFRTRPEHPLHLPAR